MNRKTIVRIWSISLLLMSCCYAEEWFSRRDINKDFKWVNTFIQHISDANYVVILGKMNDTTNQLYDVRFTIETKEHKKILQSYMTNLEIRETDPPEPLSKGNIRYIEYSVKIVNVFDDHREYFSFSGPPLMAYLSSEQSFWVDCKNFDEREFYKFLTQAGVPCENIKYTGNPPQYMPPLILGSWHTENGEVKIEFRDDGTFKIGKSPTSFCIHLNKLPDRLKGFHLLGETGKWTISDDLLSLSLSMGPPLDNGISGYRIHKLDYHNLDFRFSDYPIIRLVR